MTENKQPKTKTPEQEAAELLAYRRKRVGIRLDALIEEAGRLDEVLDAPSGMVEALTAFKTDRFPE